MPASDAETASPIATTKTVGPRAGAKLGYVALAIAIIVACWGVQDPYTDYLIKLTAINLVVIYGLNLLMGYAGQAYLAVAATFAVGAYTSALAMMTFNVPFPLAFIAAGVVAGIVGLVCGLPALRLSGPYLAMVSIAFNVVLEQGFVNWSSVTGGAIGISAIPPVSFGAFVPDNHQVTALIVLAASVTMALVITLRRSQWGIAFFAMRENEIAAASLGINTVRLKALAFLLSSMFAGLGGALYAHSIQYISPDIGTILASVTFVLMLVLGGIGTSWGPLIGTVILTLLPQMLVEFQKYHLLVLGCILLVSIIAMPEGIAPVFRRLTMRLRAPSATIGPAVQSSASGAHELISPLMAGTTLVVTDAHKSFGGIVALAGVSLSVHSGQIHGLIGPNGSGKSTLVNVISGHYAADKGEIAFNGRSFADAPMRAIAAAGMVRTFQTPQIFRNLTVLDNLRAAKFPKHHPGLVAALFDLRSSRDQTIIATDAARRLSEMLALDNMLLQRSGDLSQGDQRRLEIGRALATEPRVLILDEPAAGLSSAESAALCKLLDRLRQLGMAILLIEHHMDVIMTVCDTLTVLNRGRVIAEGKPHDIQTNPAVLDAYLGSKQSTQARRDGTR